MGVQRTSTVRFFLEQSFDSLNFALHQVDRAVSDKPAMIKPSALIIRIGPKGLLDEVELCSAETA